MARRVGVVRAGLAGLALALAASSSVGQDPPLERRVYDVAALLEASTDRAGPTLEAEDPGDVAVLITEQQAAPLSDEGLLELTRRAIGAGTGDRGRTVRLDPPLLEVRAEPAAHATVVAVLATLQAGLAAPIELRFAVHRVNAGQARGLVAACPGGTGAFAPETLSRALAGLDPGSRLGVGSVSLRPGQRGHVRALRRRTHVRDYSVEVAEAAAIGDPEVATAAYGFVADVRVRPGPDPRRLALDASLRHAWLADATRTARTGVGTIELPERAVASVDAAPILAPGTSWVGTVCAPDGSGVAFVVTWPEAPPPADATLTDGRVARAFPLDDVALPLRWGVRPELETRLVPNQDGSDDGPFRFGPRDEPRRGEDAGGWADRLRAAIAPGTWEAPGIACVVEPRALVIVHTADVVRRAAAWLAAEAAAHAPPVAFEVAVVALDTEPPVGPIADDVAAPWFVSERLLAHGWLAGRTGVPHGAALVRTVPALVDYEVEVAQGAKIPDPVVGRAREGVTLTIQADARHPGPPGVHVAIALARIVRPLRPVSTPHGPLELPEVHGPSAVATVTAPPAGWASVVIGADADGRTLVCLVRAARP